MYAYFTYFQFADENKQVNKKPVEVKEGGKKDETEILVNIIRY